MTSNGQSDGLHSLLDTDLYKLTMQCAVLKHFPDVKVSYALTNRTPDMRLNRQAFDWLSSQVHKLADLRVTEEELSWLEKTCPYLAPSYLQYLRQFQLRPDEQVEIGFEPVDVDSGSYGNLTIKTHGLWVETILYEIPLLALVSEAYFKFVDQDWNHDNQIENAKRKGLQLLESGCVFSEFGSRRRRDYRTHNFVMEGLTQAAKEAQSKNLPGKLTGTSNVHLAMRFNVNPVGTVAHEWFMGIAALTGDYANANENALRYWVDTYGPGVLAIALTDTFGTPAFLKAFVKPAKPSDGGSYAEIFTGVRQDSGDPLEFLQVMKEFYSEQNISTAKTIIFSDSLDVDKCIKYKLETEKAGLTPSFGVGTFFTNDFKHLSSNEKSVPLNIVIKISEVNGVGAVKLSDTKGKNMGPKDLVDEVKHQVHYADKSWSEGDEAHRWDAK